MYLITTRVEPLIQGFDERVLEVNTADILAFEIDTRTQNAIFVEQEGLVCCRHIPLEAASATSVRKSLFASVRKSISEYGPLAFLI